jgi:hypothetical protein
MRWNAVSEKIEATTLICAMMPDTAVHRQEIDENDYRCFWRDPFDIG